MDKRAAKREACFCAVLVIESALGNGWESLDRYGDDRDKVEDALGQLIDELERRSGCPAVSSEPAAQPEPVHLPEDR